MKHYMIDEQQLRVLHNAARRLYTEDRMDGNAMRDMAHQLTAVVKVCLELEMPPDTKRDP